MVLPAGGVPAGDGRHFALQGPLSLGGHLWNRGAVSLRVRFLFDAISSGDGVLRDHRSGGGGGAVAGRAVGGRGVGLPPGFEGGGGAFFFAQLPRETVGPGEWAVAVSGFSHGLPWSRPARAH